MSVNEKMTLLADAVRSKSGATGLLSIDGMTTAVNSITVGGDGGITEWEVINKVLTPESPTINRGRGHYDSIQVSVDHTAVDVTPTEKGFYLSAEEKFFSTVNVKPIPDNFKDVSGLNILDESFVVKGKSYCDAQGIKIGNMPDSTGSVNGWRVTVTPGHVEEEKNYDVQLGEVTVDGATVTVTEGYIFPGGEYTVEISSGATVKANVVTVGKGFLEEDLTVTIPMGVIQMVDGWAEWQLGEGYYDELTLRAQAGSVTVDGDTVFITQGYFGYNELTIPAGSVTLDTTVNKVIVEEGYVKPQEIPLPGGFQLVKVMKYTAYRAELTAPEKVVVSGLGEVSNEWGDSADFSDVNGTYTVTDDTKYLSGFERVYKQEGGSYYLRGYDPTGEEWSEFEKCWFIDTSTYVSYETKLRFDGESIPSGANNWQTSNYGAVSVTTAVTNKTYPEQPLVLNGKTVSSYDQTTGQWNCSESSTALSGCENPPEISQIFAVQNNRTIGNYIDWAGAFADECDERTLVYIPCDELELRDRSIHNRTVTRLGDENHITLEKGVFGNCWNMNGEYPGGLCYVDIPEFDVNADWCFETYCAANENGVCACYIGDNYCSWSNNGATSYTYDRKTNGMPYDIPISNKRDFPAFQHIAWQHNSSAGLMELFFNGKQYLLDTGGNPLAVGSFWESAKKIVMGVEHSSQAYIKRWDEFRLHQYRKYTGDFTPPGFEEE